MIPILPNSIPIKILQTLKTHETDSNSGIRIAHNWLSPISIPTLFRPTPDNIEWQVPKTL